MQVLLGVVICTCFCNGAGSVIQGWSVRENGDVRGRVHSIETFGTVDGPGVRLVVFCQGCPMRCLYCHNPDTWNITGGTEMTVDEILETYNRNRNFYRSGGITATGGEPLVQPEFVGALFRAAHDSDEGSIHTCLDTSGGMWSGRGDERFKQVLDHCDLVLFDIKHSDPEKHKELCGIDIEGPLAFGDELARLHIPTVIRHVCVPGITDTDEELAGVGKIIARWDNIIGLEVLPYHTMGVQKYKNLGIPYPLEGVEALPKIRVQQARKIILNARAEGRVMRARARAKRITSA